MATGPLLLIGSAFLHAGWNALAKSSQDKESFLFLTILLSGLFTFMTVLVFGQLEFPNNTVVALGFLSGIFEGLYFLTLAKALRTTSLGKSYSIMRGGAMIVVWMISTVFLQERAAFLQYLGAFTILAGIFTMNMAGRTKEDHALFKTEDIWSYLSAVFIAGYHLTYHQALERGAEPRTLFFIAMVVSLPFLFWSIRKSPFARIRDTVKTKGWTVVATGAGATASFLIFLYGLKISAPGFAISLRNTSIFFAVIFSYFLKESLTRKQILSACAIGLGAFLLSL
ncbi:multidrug DMT transporter permease [Bdellovibrio bacteriovorus]|uniref:Multidrug DMT transporter permease n=1 Tax=Bdellovibrio bacteriovorus TaxID=959 RepID=A0A150WDU3_BDEBC|nr:EamA family transporter [Bdellovibrio bacteriovorus]KYG61042.1 multidrug DMT transporter permease [Bdellovibrio bacteriovorus]